MAPAAPLPTPLDDDQWPPELARFLDGFAGRLNVYRQMAHHPALLMAWENLRNHLVLNSALTPMQLEVVILRTGHRWGSHYEWEHHVHRGQIAGLNEERIEAARQKVDELVRQDDDPLLISAVDALLNVGRISPVLLHSLTARFGTTGVLDLMATVGMYSTLAFLAKTYEVPMDVLEQPF